MTKKMRLTILLGVLMGSVCWAFAQVSLPRPLELMAVALMGFAMGGTVAWMSLTCGI